MTAPSGSAQTLVRVFTQRFSSTRRGARLARCLAMVELHDWGIPHRTPLSEDAERIVAEFTANAVIHGHAAGRDFELRLTLLGGVLRIEVSDARRERRPALQPHAYQAEGGYGLRIVDAVAADWGVTDRVIGKTVWAELRTSSG
ncbi:ATP-binding protein [Streptomyces sp. NBC_01006]|uniref:ATP-binding protein n=1 Tax=Streptomyces sp. NBC_01006 TaxID=2903716 RepID=UPI00386C361B|nr:ATP-binding protein [Streptomyces sp. NBC_01006]